ncbi:pyruvate dehydrogenase E1 component subunit beta-1, mitochondrial isoform X1, partial [Tanacetum coccineum]
IIVRDVLNSALDEDMATDPDVFVMGEQVGEYQSAYEITKGLLDKYGPERVVDTPITEVGFVGIIVGSTYHGLKSVIEFMTFSFSMQDLLRFCIKTIWDKGLDREQNVGVPIYGETSDLLISEVREVRDFADLARNLLDVKRSCEDPIRIQGRKVNVSRTVSPGPLSLIKSFAEVAKWLGLANWVNGQNGDSVTAGALID